MQVHPGLQLVLIHLLAGHHIFPSTQSKPRPIGLILRRNLFLKNQEMVPKEEVEKQYT